MDKDPILSQKSDKSAKLVLTIILVVLGLVLSGLIFRFSSLRASSKIITLIIPLLMAGILLLCRLPPGFRVHTVQIVRFVVIGAYLLELFISLNPNDATAALERKRKALHLDNRTPYEVLTDLRKKGYNPVPFLTPDYFLQHQPLNIGAKTVYPLGGVSESLTVLCNEGGRWATYQSDEHGFNNPTGLYNPGQVDIVADGDSYTQGDCVNPKDNAIGVIRQTYPRTINLGLGGGAFLDRLAVFREYVQRLKPKVVLWIYTENTMYNISPEGPLLEYFQENYSQGLYDMQPQLDQSYKALIGKEEKEKFLEKKLNGFWIRVILLWHIRNDIEQFPHQLASIFKKQDVSDQKKINFQKILKIMSGRARQWGGKLVFVYIPENDPHSDHDAIVSMVRGLNVPVVDLLPMVNSQPDVMSLYPLRMYAHFNEKGYKLMGETILNYIKSIDTGEFSGR